ncbi:MAG: heparinase II/III-family protein [Gammaproteobacteria bacterium]|nr:heparinase II/III-family protein [Gammaproteobacteria bacterium]
MSSATKRVYALRSKLRTYWALGIPNIINVALYRLAKKHGFYTRLTPASAPLRGPFYEPVKNIPSSDGISDIVYFSHHHIKVDQTPDWFCNPFSDARPKRDDRHWSSIPDNYSTSIGDIKVIWEPSRFDWLPKLAWRYKKQSNAAALPTLETWLQDWADSNPVNSGFNWKCGQETSFRAMNALLAAKIIGAPFQNPSAALLRFYTTHVQRILPTTRYAMAQDNNHGTSEAACLFIIGAYLKSEGNDAQSKLGARCIRIGRRWLENRIKKLIMADGSFSQHSITYHRVLLDTLCFTELFRTELGQKKFSDQFYINAAKATQWYSEMINIESGDAPNLGSNDGAYLFNSNEQPYRDFRPTAAIALNLFCKQRLATTKQHSLTSIFNIDHETLPEYSHGSSALFPDGGYCLLRAGKLLTLMRLPVFKFRPGQSDAHHLDVWFEGTNLIRDGGSFCYNSGNDEISDFYTGSKSHSSVRFDNRNQMPKVSHFLIGDWLKPAIQDFDPSANSIKSGYVDSYKASHERTVQLSDTEVKIVDVINGFEQKAELRWRLAPLKWQLIDTTLKSDGIELSVNIPVGSNIELIEEYESLHYLQQELIPVLLVTVNTECQLETTITIDPARLSANSTTG